MRHTSRAALLPRTVGRGSTLLRAVVIGSLGGLRRRDIGGGGIGRGHRALVGAEEPDADHDDHDGSQRQQPNGECLFPIPLTLLDNCRDGLTAADRDCSSSRIGRAFGDHGGFGRIPCGFGADWFHPRRLNFQRTYFGATGCRCGIL